MFSKGSMTYLKQAETDKELYIVNYEKMAADKEPNSITGEMQVVPINVLNIQRGVCAKTTGAKDYQYKKWLKTGYRGVWLKNTIALIDREVSGFIESMYEFYPEWGNCELGGSSKKGYILNHRNEDDRLNKVMYLAALSMVAGVKGSRDPLYQDVFIDEYNVDDNLVKNQMRKIMSIMGTVKTNFTKHAHNPARIWLMGNSTSIANSFLVGIGVYNIEDEITIIYNKRTGRPLVRLFVPQIDIKEAKDYYKNDWLYDFGELVGETDHVYHNVTFDDSNGIIPHGRGRDFIKALMTRTVFTLNANGSIIECHIPIGAPKKWEKRFVITTELSSEFKRDYSIENASTYVYYTTKGTSLAAGKIPITTDVKNSIKEMIGKDRFRYESIHAKNILLSIL